MTHAYLILQDWFIGAVTRPMYRAWLKQAVASGVIKVTPRFLTVLHCIPRCIPDQ
ncbi:hypothetical protein ACLB1S_11745 [Escherichia coli]